MDIPANLTMRNTVHGSGAKRMAFYGYEDNAGLGVRMEARRKDGRSPFVETWFLDALPGREFASFKDLREAALPLTDVQIAAETADKYPLIRGVEPDSCSNRCRLCPRTELAIDSATRAPEKYDTWRVVLAYSWKDSHSLSLCDEHLEKFQNDAKGLRAAIEAEVEQRRARAASNAINNPAALRP